ncbi:MAG TPA: TonB-dependent receptor [Candidatus Wallbacteria bacterium]|nr:TonB-dependent receptor [Candidatus Wallbacteria bacterium]
MKRLTSKIIAFMSAALLSATPLNASSPSVFELSLDELARVVVTDTKVAQSPDSVTQKVEILDAEEINRHTSLKRNLSELLIYKSGLFVNALSRNDANWGSFGGLGPKYNGYLLDGLPIDCFVDTMSLDPWILERVELYKGPASVMYSNYLSMDFSGNQTPLTGITNFVLKDGIAGPLTRVRLGGGSYRTEGGKFYHQNGNPRFNYFIGGGVENSDYADYGAPGSWLNILRAPSYVKRSAYAGASRKFGAGQKFSLFANRTVHAGDAGRPNRDYDHGYDVLNLTYANQISEKINLQLKGGYRGYDRYWGEDNFPADLGLRNHSVVKQKIMPFDFSINYRHKGESLLTLGMDSQFAAYKNFSEVNGLRTVDVDAASVSRGFFLQEKLILGKWILRGGGRLNRASHSYALINGAMPAGDSTKTWSRALWSFGARYNKSQNLAFYANAGTSFVAPAAKQIWGTASGQIANPGIREENGAGYDFGMEWRPDSKLTLGARALVNELDNAIIDNVVSRNPSRTQSVNSGKARSYGLELMAERKESERLRWFANLTRISSKVENPLNADHDGTNIPFVPDYAANAGLKILLTGEVTLSPYVHVAGNYYDSTSRSGRTRFGPYQIINLKIQKEFPEKNGYESGFFIDLNNITDKRYEMPWQFQETGFNAYIGVEARF